MKPADLYRLAKRATEHGFNKGFTQAFTGFWFPWEGMRRVRAAKPAMMAWLCTVRGISACMKPRFRLPL